MVQLLQSAAGLNEEAAEVFLEALPMDFRNQHPSHLMANVWAKQNRDEAMAWAAALPMGEGREDALRGLANELPPDEATAAWFNALPPSAGRDAIAERLNQRPRAIHGYFPPISVYRAMMERLNQPTSAVH